MFYCVKTVTYRFSIYGKWLTHLKGFDIWLWRHFWISHDLEIWVITLPYMVNNSDFWREMRSKCTLYTTSVLSRDHTCDLDLCQVTWHHHLGVDCSTYNPKTMQLHTKIHVFTLNYMTMTSFPRDLHVTCTWLVTWQWLVITCYLGLGVTHVGRRHY